MELKRIEHRISNPFSADCSGAQKEELPTIPESSRAQTYAIDPAESASEPAAGLGYLDFLEIFEASFHEMSDVSSRVTDAVNTLGGMSQRTSEIHRGHAMDQSSQIRYWKRTTNALAHDMQDFPAQNGS